MAQLRAAGITEDELRSSLLQEAMVREPPISPPHVNPGPNAK